MNRAKRLLLLPLVLVAIGGAIILSAANSRAGTPPPDIVIPAMRVSGLNALSGIDLELGRYLHVFYVSARESVIGFDGQKPKVHSVFSMVRLAIPVNGIVEVPSAKISRPRFSRFTQDCNYVMFAITGSQPSQLFLKNPDNSYAVDLRATEKELDLKGPSAFAYNRMGFISLSDLKSFPQKESTILIDAEKSLHFN